MALLVLPRSGGAISLSFQSSGVCVEVCVCRGDTHPFLSSTDHKRTRRSLCGLAALHFRLYVTKLMCQGRDRGVHPNVQCS